MLNQEFVKKLVQKLRIDSFSIQREYLQLLFLKHFYNQKESASVFFKGGTAIRLLFGSFRFSEDLDFTSQAGKKTLKQLVAKTVKDLSKEEEGVVFKEEKTITDAFSGRIFQKLEEFNFPLTIRLDFSLREKPVSTETSIIETVFPIGPYPQVAHFKAEELLAEKIRAIFARVRGRDIFDLWFLLSVNTKIDWKLVNKKMALYNKKVTVKQLEKRIQSVSEEELKNDLTKFLPVSHRKLTTQIKNLALDKIKRGLSVKFQ